MALLARVTHSIRLLRRPFRWIRRAEEKEQDTEGRALVVRLLIAVIWVPIQITVSLIFATGGIFFVLILGIILGPFVGLFFLIRHMVRRPDGETEAEGAPGQDDHGGPKTV